MPRYLMEVHDAGELVHQDPFGGMGVFLPSGDEAEEILGRVQEVFGTIPAVAYPERGAWIDLSGPAPRSDEAITLWGRAELPLGTGRGGGVSEPVAAASSIRAGEGHRGDRDWAHRHLETAAVRPSASFVAPARHRAHAHVALGDRARQGAAAGGRQLLALPRQRWWRWAVLTAVAVTAAAALVTACAAWLIR